MHRSFRNPQGRRSLLASGRSSPAVAGPLASAFTLVELLVVVAIIVILIAILLPAMEQAMEYAQRAKCAANLHAFGAGFGQYSSDNQFKLPATPGNFGGVYPPFIWTNPHATDLSIDKLERYTAGVTRQSGVPIINGGVWLCPSNGVNMEPINTAYAGYGWEDMHYSYFGRAELWPATLASRPQDLTENLLSSSRLLMADAIFRAHESGTWQFNHGVNGYAQRTALVRTGVQPQKGANQLYGDGSAFWKKGEAFDADLMDSPNPDPAVPYVKGGGSDITFY